MTERIIYAADDEKDAVRLFNNAHIHIVTKIWATGITSEGKMQYVIEYETINAPRQ